MTGLYRLGDDAVQPAGKLRRALHWRPLQDQSLLEQQARKVFQQRVVLAAQEPVRDRIAGSVISDN